MAPRHKTLLAAGLVGIVLLASSQQVTAKEQLVEAPMAAVVESVAAEPAKREPEPEKKEEKAPEEKKEEPKKEEEKKEEPKKEEKKPEEKKEESHDDEATTAQTVDSVKPAKILHMLWDGIDTQLHNQAFQWANGLIAFAVGLVMTIDGEFVFKYLVVGGVAVFVFLLSMSFLENHYEDRFPHQVYQIIAVEAAAALAVVAYKGYDGILVLVGLLLGAVFYYYFHAFCDEHVSAPFAESWGFFLIIGNMCVACGVFLFMAKARRRAMAFTSSLTGGCLLSSSMAYFAMLLAVHFRGKLNNEGFDVPEECPAWIDFLEVLLFPSKEPVGIFVGSKYNPQVTSKGPSSLDRWLGVTFWVIFFSIGVLVQVKMEKNRADRKTSEVAAREADEFSLNSPLLLA
eukprot:TRINITY_DN787_c0_g1_i1.p1 TRINITY_DN787_c0_g1~~TRINITY_DN787_c0_g1_i1.p1  ORF type:complete len:437 (-),score=144.32 TRINITY_DN787_c0_g1_i1:49-1245(-)